MKLVQKRLFKATREFEIADDSIHVRTRTAFKEEKRTVLLSTLNPEPTVNGSCLEFYGRVKGHPLLTLYRDEPDNDTFERFVGALKQRARDEFNAFAGLRAGAPAGNSYEEPPEFGEPRKPRLDAGGKRVNAASIDSSIVMLRQHLDGDEIDPLIVALEALKSEPDKNANFARLVSAFDALGSRQGAVLTYAPYITILLSDDPFGY